jgi:hypothetical protein
MCTDTHAYIHTYIHTYKCIPWNSCCSALCSTRTGEEAWRWMPERKPTYTHVSIYVCVCVCMCLSVYLSVCMYVPINLHELGKKLGDGCLKASTRTCEYVYMYVCAWIWREAARWMPESKHTYIADGQLIASGGWDKTISIRHADTGKLVHVLQGLQGDVEHVG